jgi:hypothetical protein
MVLKQQPVLLFQKQMHLSPVPPPLANAFTAA